MLRRVRVPSVATAAVHGTKPSASAAPPIQLGAQHSLLCSLAYDQASGLLAVGGGGAPSAQALLLLAKRPPAAPPLALPSLSLWALSDAPPHHSLLFATTTTVHGGHSHFHFGRRAHSLGA